MTEERPEKCVIMTQSDLDAFRAEITELEARVRELEAEINDLRKGMRGLSFARNLYHPPR